MGKKWTKAQDEALTTMHGSKMTAKEIGLILGRTEGSVSQRARNLNITDKRQADTTLSPAIIAATEKHMRLYDATPYVPYDMLATRSSFPAPLPLPAASEETAKPSMLERMFTKMLGR